MDLRPLAADDRELRHTEPRRASRLRRIGAHILPITAALAAALALETWLGDGFTWLPRSILAWVAALAVFVIGEGFLQWLMRQAKHVAHEDVLFRGLSPRGRNRDTE